MNIYVNMQLILIKMEELKTPDSNKVLLIDFLNSILSSISNSLGGINKLEAVLDETTNTIIIRDANPLPNIDKVIATLNALPGKKYSIPNKFTEFDLYGYNKDKTGTHASFIKDFSFKTEITPELSTMLTVGATANSKVVGENSTAFSKFNAGLTDRFKEQIVQSREDITPSLLQEFNEKLSESQELFNKFKTLLKDYVDYLIGLSRGQFNPNDAETYKDALTNYLTYYQQYRQAQYQIDYAIKFKKRPPPLFAPNTGFIPFNLSITMDGLSGMKIYSKFLIDVDFLPSNYPENADFLIKNIQHVIENNKWFTTLESIVISKGGADPSIFSKNLSSVQQNAPQPTTAGGSPSPVTGGTNGRPLSHVDENLSSIRNAILRVAKGYVGQSEVPGFDNQKFVDPIFQAKMKSIGWSSYPTAYWCNWFTDLVWREAYTQVGATDPKIQNIFKTKLNSRVLPPLTAGCFNTLKAAVNGGFGKDLGGINIQSAKNVALPKPGDMIIYSSGHTNICIAVDPINRTFDTIGGNEGTANNRNGSSVKVTRKYWSTQKIKGIVSVIEN